MRKSLEVDRPGPESIRKALESLLQSPQFATAPRASRFIRFVVETALAGRQETLKEYVLGVEVLDRGPSFDPSTDTIVRVEAVKLRKRLRAYYRGAGRKEPVIIDIPKGGYAPEFRFRVTRAAVPTSDGQVRIAVLPFSNSTPGAENEYWSDGLTDELTSVLSQATRLNVVSRTSAFAFKGKAMDVRAIGRSLGASVVVEGAVRRQESRVRVVAQLTQVATGVQLWSGAFERELRDAWAVQQEIAEAIVAAVDIELTAGERRRMGSRHTSNSEAFELCLKGRQLLARIDVPSQREAARLFELACAADPAYPLPLLGIARSHMHLAMLGVAPPGEIVPRAKAALAKALHLDPELAEAHALMASLISRHEWNWPEAARHYRIALRLAPNSPEVHDEYAREYLAPLGRVEEALAENRIARELDPFSPQFERSDAFILLLARRLPEAEAECRRILQSRPEDAYARLVLAIALHGQRRVPEALEQYRAVYELDPTLHNEAYVASVRALSGDPEPARELLARLTDRARNEYVPAMIFVWLHLHLRQIDEGASAIERAYANREYELLIAKMGYGFDSFRQHPRFQAVLEKLGLPS